MNCLVQCHSMRFSMNDEIRYLTLLNTVQEPYFEFDRACRLIGIKHVASKTLNISPENITKRPVRTNGGIKNKNVINYSGILELLFSTHNDIAKQIQKMFISQMNTFLLFDTNKKHLELTNTNQALNIQLQEHETMLNNLRLENVKLLSNQYEIDKIKEQLKDTNTKFQNYKEQSRKYIVNDKNDKHISITERLCNYHLLANGMTMEQYKKLSKAIYSLCNCGCKQTHVIKNGNMKIFKRHVAIISIIFSDCYKRHYNEPPALLSRQRINRYTLLFYQAHGDELIRQYLNEHPFTEWGISMSCKMFNKN